MISSAEEFRDLVQLIAQDEPNPHRVTEILIGKLSGHSDALIVALAQTAPSWVATFMKRPHLTPPSPPAPRAASIGSTANGYGPTFSSGDAKPMTVLDSEGNRRASRKQAGLVDWYAARLAVSVKFGPSTSDWKRLSDCTVTDLDWMIEERLGQAAKNADTADKYRRLRDALASKKIATVSGLDIATGREILKN